MSNTSVSSALESPASWAVCAARTTSSMSTAGGLSVAVLRIPEFSADGDSTGAAHTFFVVVNRMASSEKRLWTSSTKRQREMHLQVSLQRMQCAHGPVGTAGEGQPMLFHEGLPEPLDSLSG